MDEEEKEHVPEKKSKHKISLTKKIRENPWIISTVVLCVLVVIMLLFGTSATGNVVSEKKASDNLINFLNEQTGGGVSYVSSESEGLMYKVTVLYNSQEIPVYVTKDGKYYVQPTPLTSQDSGDSNSNVQDIPKSDKPEVELFVMSYCP